MKFLIDRKELPYDAFVNDPSWLIPIDDEEGGDAHGYEGPEAETNGSEDPGRKSGKETVKHE